MHPDRAAGVSGVDEVLTPSQVRQTAEAIAAVQEPDGAIPWTVGGHIRIYSDAELIGKATDAGLAFDGKDYAHGLHTPYWWIKCAVGVDNDTNPAVKAYHRLLVWDIMKKPRTTRYAERVLDPLIGKSMVLYFRKPEAPAC